VLAKRKKKSVFTYASLHAYGTGVDIYTPGIKEKETQ
jgi:hypothetical protein